METHTHSPSCGHPAVKHGAHVDYLQNGRLQHQKSSGGIEDHRIDVSSTNPDVCKPLSCTETGRHAADSEKIPHGDHQDFLVDGRLHHVHDGHCDDHGPVSAG